jgi:polyribonucleotide nucleotidyltransferase
MAETINPYGKKIIKVETDFCGKKLSLEVNRVGFRTSSSVLARYGDTVVLGTAMVSSGKLLKAWIISRLSIDYEEKMYAAGKISGSRFIKREGRPSDDAYLIGRLIDRPIRPACGQKATGMKYKVLLQYLVWIRILDRTQLL